MRFAEYWNWSGPEIKIIRYSFPLGLPECGRAVRGLLFFRMRTGFPLERFTRIAASNAATAVAMR